MQITRFGLVIRCIGLFVATDWSGHDHELDPIAFHKGRRFAFNFFETLPP